MNSPSPAHLTLFGNPCLRGRSGAPVTGRAAQRHRIALLSLLTLAAERGASRDWLMAQLWPESDLDRARKLLNASVYVLRKELGENAIVSRADHLRLNSAVVASDVTEFEAATRQRQYEQVVALHTAPFLEGFFLPDAAEFEWWAERERARMAAIAAKALEALADAAEARQDFVSTAEWWSRRAAHDPYDSRVALRLMRALESSGNRAAALRHAAAHQRVLREEYGTEPSSEMVAFGERLRAESPVGAGSGAERGAAAARERATAAPPRESEPATPAASATASRGPTEVPGKGNSFRHYGLAALLLAAGVVAVIWLWPAPTATRLADAPEASGRRSTGNVAAYELYLRGSDPALLRSDSSALQAAAYFEQAVALDTMYAAAWAGLARAYARLAGGEMPLADRERYSTMAHAAAHKAVALDDSLADPHATLALLSLRSFDASSAERHLSRVVQLDPTNPLAPGLLVYLALWNGRPADALSHARRAVELDPLSPDAHAALASALLHNERCDEALAHLQTLMDLRPPLQRAAPLAALCYARNQNWPDAIAVLRPQAERGDAHALALLGYVLARAGERQEATRIRDTLLERRRQGSSNGYQVALLFAGLGDPDQAFTWIHRSITDYARAGVPGRTVTLILLGPLAEELGHDPRFQLVRNRIGLQMP